MSRRKLWKWLIIVCALVAAIIAYPAINGKGMRLPKEVSGHPLFAVYQANFSYKPLTGAVTDLNDDGLSDILVVYSFDRQHNHIIAILDGKTPIITPDEAAPLENVSIEFKDIDKTPPVEFIVSGSRGSFFGYGIYRIKENAIFNIFSANMEDCC